MATYAEKCKDVRWQRLRNKVLERDNYTCQASNCGATSGSMEVHHLDYIPGLDPWDYPMDMLRTLCETCHDKERGREKMETHLATTLKTKGFLLSDLLAFSCKLETDIDFTKSLLNTLRDFQE